MRFRLLLAGSLALITSLLVAGCSQPISGIASAPSAARTDLLGDTTTLDPCSLVTSSDLESYGKLDPELGSSYEECSMDVTPPSTKPGTTELNPDKALTLSISFDNLTSPELTPDSVKARTKQQGSLSYTTATTYDAGNNSQHCGASITLPTQQRITYDGTPRTQDVNEICPFIDKAVQSGLKAIQNGTIKHKSLPASTWGSKSYCDLITSSDVSSVPNVNVDTTVFMPGNHNCFWGSSLSNLFNGPINPRVSIDLILDHATIANVNSDDRKYLTDLNGTQVLLKPFAATTTDGVAYPPTCKAKAFGRKIRDADTSGASGSVHFELDEVTEVYVIDDLPEAQRCDLAKNLLGKLMTKLPPAN